MPGGTCTEDRGALDGRIMVVWSLPAERVGAQAEGADTRIIVHANVIEGVSNSPLMDATVVVIWSQKPAHPTQ